MDSESRIRQLEEDLRNAREMINCLNGTVKTFMKTEKPGKDEDLHSKIDKLLENQCEVQREVQNLKEKLVNVAKEVAECKEIKHISDVVETCEGYQELFVKDFAKILTEIQRQEANTERLEKKFTSFGGKIENLEKSFVAIKEKNQNQLKFGAAFENFEKDIKAKMDNIERNVAGLKNNEQNIVRFGGKIEKLESQFKDQIGGISKMLTEMKQTLGNQDTSRNLDLGRGEIEVILRPPRITENVVEHVPDSGHKCWKCKAGLPINHLLRVDGVSVECPKCRCENIVAKLEVVQRWIAHFCDDVYHFHPHSRFQIQPSSSKCPVCGIIGPTYERNDWVALPC